MRTVLEQQVQNPLPLHHYPATAHWLSKQLFIYTEDWGWCQGTRVYVCLSVYE